MIKQYNNVKNLNKQILCASKIIIYLDYYINRSIKQNKLSIVLFLPSESIQIVLYH